MAEEEEKKSVQFQIKKRTIIIVRGGASPGRMTSEKKGKGAVFSPVIKKWDA